MSIDNLMHAVFAGKPGTFKMELDQEMQNRINDRIDHYKDFVKANFNNPDAEYTGYQPSDQETDQSSENKES